MEEFIENGSAKESKPKRAGLALRRYSRSWRIQWNQQWEREHFMRKLLI